MSWFRGYDLGILGDIPPRDLISHGGPPEGQLLDIQGHDFFDIQALRLGHFARMRISPIEFSGKIRLPYGDRQIKGSVSVHLLAHASGFLLIRPTITAESVHVDGGVGMETLRQFDRAFWLTDYPLLWNLPRADKPLAGGVRCLMNWVFLDLYERIRGTSGSPTTTWAAEGASGCDRLHQMRADRHISYPFPVSFVTQYEFVDRSLDPLIAEKPEEFARFLAHNLLYPEDPSVQVDAIDLGRPAPVGWWFLAESQSLTLATEGRRHPELDVIDADRTQVLEYLALRRTALTCVQRDTQRVLTERRPVSRGQVERWQHIVASTTDDYVLHTRKARLLEPLHRHYEADPRIRDLSELEAQVRANLSWFQQRMDSLSQWTGGLVGASIGAAAMVLSLQEVVKSLLAGWTGIEVDKVLDAKGPTFALIMLSLMCVSFVFSLISIQLITSRLQPFSFQRSSKRTAARLRKRKHVPPAPLSPTSSAPLPTPQPETPA